MAFSVPTLAEVVRSVENGFSIAFYGSAGPLRVSVLKVLAKAFGGAVYLLVLCCGWIWRNNFIVSADALSLSTKHATRLNLPRKPASFAHGSAFFIASGATTVKAGTILVNPSSGVEFELLEDVTFTAAGNKSANIVAVVSGFSGNVGIGATLQFRDITNDNITGIRTVTQVTGGASYDVQVGSEIQQWGETLEDYRNRLLDRERNQPQGGAEPDYKSWLMRFEFVSDVWTVPNWPLTNNVSCFIADNRTVNAGIPASDVKTAQNYLSTVARRPITSRPIVAAATFVGLYVNISSPGISDAEKSDVDVALQKLLKKYGPGDTVEINEVRNMIRSVTGNMNAVLNQFMVNGVNYDTSYTLPKSNNGQTISGAVFGVAAISYKWNA
ncbi:MAG: baseplate J/gp47 family protein [Treponema sp.]|nr:baseplate J/gp47 family protein [Candidatus Treponema caballi]